MSAGEVAAVVLSVAATIAVVGLLFTLAAAVRALSAFRRSVEQITDHTLPLIADMHAAIKQANADLMKVDTLLDTAESFSTTVDSASRLAYRAFSSPLMKVIALGSGAAKAFRHLRGRRAGAG